MPEDPHGSPDTQAFGQSTEDFPHASRRGLEAVQHRAIADAELCVACLALEIPDVCFSAVAATADKGVGLIIDDAEVEAVRVGTGIPSRRDLFLATAWVFDL